MADCHVTSFYGGRGRRTPTASILRFAKPNQKADLLFVLENNKDYSKILANNQYFGYDSYQIP